MVNECMDGLVAAVIVVYSVMLFTTVRETDGSLTVSDSDRGNGIDADKRAGVVLLVIKRIYTPTGV